MRLRKTLNNKSYDKYSKKVNCTSKLYDFYEYIRLHQGSGTGGSRAACGSLKEILRLPYFELKSAMATTEPTITTKYFNKILSNREIIIENMTFYLLYPSKTKYFKLFQRIG